MHLKNFALLRDLNDDIRLSPAYDLVPTNLLLLSDKEESALTINGKKTNLKRFDFDKLAFSLSINEKVVSNIYTRFSKIIHSWNPLIEKSFLSIGMKQNFAMLVKKRYEQIQL